MKKLKVFYDPIEQIPVWLNSMAKQGYRLKTVNGCLYSFEKSNAQVRYSVQFIGYDSNHKNKEYIHMLEESGFKTFRAPLNQLNFAFGKVRLRPLASGSAKISTTMDNYNKEILIVESIGNSPSELLTTNSDKSLAYKKTRNAYIQGLLAILMMAFAVAFKFVKNSYRIDFITSLLGILVLVLLVFILVLTFKAHNKYKQFLKKARSRE